MFLGLINDNDDNDEPQPIRVGNSGRMQRQSGTPGKVSKNKGHEVGRERNKHCWRSEINATDLWPTARNPEAGTSSEPCGKCPKTCT